MTASRTAWPSWKTPALLVAGALLALAAVLAGVLGTTKLLGKGAASGEYRGTPLDGDAAPPFTLTDQHGAPVSLRDFRGKVVVLTFMDTECVDVCPLVGREFLAVDRELGWNGKRVVYLAVNVNAGHASVEDAEAFTRQYGLDALPDWHLLTGSPSALERVWSDYFIGVREAGGHLDHTAAVYVLDTDGRLRHLFTADVSDSNLGALREVLLEQVRKLG